MPVAVMHGGAQTSSVSSSSSAGPNSHLCLAVVAFLINPLFGLIAICFAISSKHVAPRDWDGARVRGKIAMFLSVTGIVISLIGLLVFVLIFFTEDS